MKKIASIILILGIGYGLKAQDETINGNLTINGGTGGTSKKLIFKTSDNADLSKYIGTENYWTIIGANGNEGWKFKDNSGDILMQINGLGNNSGYVGIGTTNPNAKLDVNGGIGAQETMVVKRGGSYLVALNGQDHGYISGRNSSFQDKFLIHSNGNSFFNGGNVGIGTANPDAKLRIEGTNSLARFMTEENGKFEIYATRVGSSLAANLVLGAQSNIILDPNKHATSGNVGIGTYSPDSKLTVKGNIHAEEVKVDLLVPAPDYVFKADYDLRTLEETQNYIDEHGHLPNIPSAKEMKKNGIELGEMNMKLLEKIEELILYALEQEEKIEKERALNKKQEERLEKVEKLLNQK